MLNLIVSIDIFVIIRLFKLVVFCVEWFSVSRKMIDRFLISLHVSLCVLMIWLEWKEKSKIWNHHLLYVEVISTILFNFLMLIWQNHVREKPLEEIIAYDPSAGFFRVLWGLVFMPTFSIITILSSPHRMSDWAGVGASFVWIIMWYLLSVPTGGQKGKRRKAALEKLASSVSFLPSAAESLS